MAGYKVKLKLEDLYPETWREVIIPRFLSFKRLHNIIQTAFGFHNLHTYQFTFKENKKVIEDWERGKSNLQESYNSQTTLINKYFEKYKTINYRYDPLEKWDVEIEILEKIEYKETNATLTDHKGEWQMLDDIGGSYYMADIIRIYEEYPKDGTKIIKELDLIQEEELEETLIHQIYLEEFEKFKKTHPETSQNYEKELEEFNMEFITENEKRKEYFQEKQNGMNLDKFIDLRILGYEDYSENIKFEKEHIKRRIKMM